jgi:hypothetical protein
MSYKLLNVTMAKTATDLVLQTNHLGQNAIAIDETCFTSTILSVRVEAAL